VTDVQVTRWPGYDIERSSVRVVLLDDDGRMLLFRTVDPTMPDLGEWWELPGGGVEAGESFVDTAVREIAEETGFELARAAVGVPTWRRDSTYVRRHRRTWQHEVVVVAHVVGRAPVPAREGRTEDELQEYVGHRWWDVADLVAAGGTQRFFPGRLPELIEDFLAGVGIDEPFDLWN
jgi:8-oxo-dGTP pyrophosphatase MutT (NUDIX family)